MTDRGTLDAILLAAMELIEEGLSVKDAVRAVRSLSDESKSVRSSPFRNRKSLSYRTKAEGTCKQGERSDLTGCTPASGDVDSSDEDADLNELEEEETDEDSDEWKEYEREHTEWEKAHAFWEAQVAEMDAAYAISMEEHDKKVAALEAEYEEAKAEYESRVDARSEIRSLMEDNTAESAFDAAVPQSLPSNLSYGEEDAEQAGAAANQYVQTYLAAWQAAYGPDGPLMKKLMEADVSEDGRGKVAGVVSQGTSALEKAGKACVDVYRRHADSRIDLETHELTEPQEPMWPDDADENDPVAQEKYDRVLAEYEAAHEKWANKKDKLDEKETALLDKANKTVENLDTLISLYQEKIDTALDLVQKQRGKELDAEDEADEEPEEPIYSEGPDEPDYPEEPEEPESPDDEAENEQKMILPQVSPSPFRKS